MNIQQALLQVTKSPRNVSEALQDFHAWMRFVGDHGSGNTHTQRIRSLGGIEIAVRLYRERVILL